jgi:hypothetical protein
MHTCKDGEVVDKYGWWVHDYQGIPLCKVCDDCEQQKLSRYNPWVLTGYDQSDVDELIEEA